jgi:segment polarity protein dishevelled
VVNWLFTKVQGFTEKREAKKYASQMLKTGFIKHTVNKVPMFGTSTRFSL